MPQDGKEYEIPVELRAVPDSPKPLCHAAFAGYSNRRNRNRPGSRADDGATSSAIRRKAKPAGDKR